MLLLVGFWASIQVLIESLRLYRDPINIEKIAEAIEHSSNLDRNLSQNFSSETSDHARHTGRISRNHPSQEIRLTYFVAWVLVLLILLLVGMIALSFVRTGSELVLQDGVLKNQMQQLQRQLKQ